MDDSLGSQGFLLLLPHRNTGANQHDSRMGWGRASHFWRKNEGELFSKSNVVAFGGGGILGVLFDLKRYKTDRLFFHLCAGYTCVSGLTIVERDTSEAFGHQRAKLITKRPLIGFIWNSSLPLCL